MKMNPGGSWRWIVIGGGCLLGLVTSRVFAAEPAAVFRFGSAELYSQLTNQFAVPNSSAEAVEIISVTPSCECISVLRWADAVKAGETGIVDILFVPDKVGAVDYRVFVKTSSPDHPDIEFAVQGVVTAAPLTRMDRDWTLYVGTEEADKLVQNPDSLIWVDIRSPKEYAGARIPGSLQIPLYAVKTKGFLRGRRVVLVNEGYGSRAVEEEVRRLRAMGFSDLSLWYGGMNAWRRRGGALEGAGTIDVERLPPEALSDIVLSTDWLVVAADAEAPKNLPDSVAIPFNPEMKEAFATALNAAIAARPQVAAVLILTETGDNYRVIAAVADQINAFVYFLEGGRDAWESRLQMLDAIRHSRTVMASSTSGGIHVRPGGCGGCPK